MKTRKVSLLFGSLLFLSGVHLFAVGTFSFDNLGAPPERRTYRSDWVIPNGQPQFVSDATLNLYSEPGHCVFALTTVPEPGIGTVSCIIGAAVLLLLGAKRGLPSIRLPRSLLASTIMLASIGAYAQGSGIVTFSNVGANDAGKIHVVNGGVSGYASGTAYAIALYWGPATTMDDREMIQVGPAANFLTGTAAGMFFGGGRTITGFGVNGPVLAFQARGWCTVGGTVTSYEQALFSSITGKGPIFLLKTKDPTNPLETTPSVGQAPGWAGFYIMSLDGGHVCIPEPETGVLMVLAVVLLLMLRPKRKQTHCPNDQ